MGEFIHSGSYILLVVALAIIAYVAYKVYKKRDKQTRIQQVSSITALVVDNETAKLYKFVELSLEVAKKIVDKHGTLARLWDFDGKRVYAFVRTLVDGEQDYTPVTLSQSKRDPAELHYNLKQPAVELFIEEALKDDDKSFIDQWGVWLWWIAVMGFLGFMWSQA